MPRCRSHIHSSKLNEPPKFLYYTSCHHKQMIVTKEYAVSHLQRHELYHDAFLLQIRFVDCQCFPHTFDFRHWRTVWHSWLMNWVHFSIQLWTTLGKRLLRRGIKCSTWTCDWGCFIPSHVRWLTQTLIVSPGMACRHAGRFNEGSVFWSVFLLKRASTFEGAQFENSGLKGVNMTDKMNASMTKTLGNRILDLGVVKERSTLAPSCSTTPHCKVAYKMHTWYRCG